MFLVCHVISQGHMINRSREFVDGRLSLQVITLPGLVALETMVGEI